MVTIPTISETVTPMDIVRDVVVVLLVHHVEQIHRGLTVKLLSAELELTVRSWASLNDICLVTGRNLRLRLWLAQWVVDREGRCLHDRMLVESLR